MQSTLRQLVLRKVVTALEQTTHVEMSHVSESTRLADDLTLARFARVRFGLYLEDLFDLELPNDVVARFVTVADVISYFECRWFRDIEPAAKRIAA